ncbi:hypothetical protein Acsp03_66510 [Actinomadura sp. NBRC 104412]|uniref:hypothetical protein n=1 Tax=Actinomadura sp. NBRC 104412 TaxID=3032203 RepID=UPI0024A4F02A|nr:hypothetical protein [Actinomadura sp. NBRC 104412]GLZ09185.1 hypothetical protein Acsp03_66510 [Actinomadura sp. NBRC 104412]
MTVDRSDHADARTEATLAELFGPLTARLRSHERPLVYLSLLFSLIYLRHADARSWSELRDEVRAAVDGQWSPQNLLRAVGDRVVDALRTADASTEFTARLADLDAETVEDVARIVLLCEGLGVDAFHPLADRFQAWHRPQAEAFFTPRPVVQMMIELLRGGGGLSGRLHDPCLGSGEFLAGMVEAEPGVRLSGTSSSRDLIALAAMSRWDLPIRTATRAPVEYAPLRYLIGSMGEAGPR